MMHPPATVRTEIAKLCCETDTGVAGCSKASFDKAAASESPKRTFQYVEGLNDARTRSAALFNILLRAFEASHFGKKNRREGESQT